MVEKSEKSSTWQIVEGLFPEERWESHKETWMGNSEMWDEKTWEGSEDTEVDQVRFLGD